MSGRAPAGAVVGIYVDLIAHVAVGDVIRTGSGRRYGIVSVRVQERGMHAGRQHLRCLVLGPDDDTGASQVHQIYWYPRGKR
jgi:hypothetical protein